ncbi:tail fiber domain-containing protein [Sulfitobacter pontiacus]|uniref:tail fiber domain-containing protein n=1 Tax=Sulfitobacter pontiacus TaxID=60137 RepID=UPI0027711262|nr:tail fiber domain-containing protein [Sulfitobacter pontiacus]GLO78484.1 hypothetical protein MACH23_19050 [Sulfitobacter pontiacus]
MGTIAELLNTAMRDFQRYSGDGLPNEPAGRPLPVGDPASGQFNPPKKQVRDAFLAIAETADELTEAVQGAAADRVQTGLDREATQADSASTLAYRNQAQVAALAAGAPLVTALSDPTPANDTVEIVQSGAGAQVWEVVSSDWEFKGWLTPPVFDTVAQMGAEPVLIDGQPATVRGGTGGEEVFRFKIGSALPTSALVVAGVGGQWISTRTEYVNWAEFDADARTLPAGTYVRVRGIRDYITVASGQKLTLTGGLKVILAGKGPATPQHFGITGGTDCTAKLKLLAASGAKGIHFPKDPGGDYLTSETIQFGANCFIDFEGGAYIRATAIDQGAVINLGPNSMIYNKQIDGGGPGIITGGSGQNGIGVPSGSGKVYGSGGHIRNCARGSAAPYDGGKAVQVENNNTIAAFYGVKVDNAHIAASARRDTALGEKQKVIFSGFIVDNVNHLLYVGMSNIAISDLSAHGVIFSDFIASNVGAYDEGPNPDAGLFIFNRANQVSISNGNVHTATKLGGIWRGRGRNLTIDNVTYNGNVLAAVNLDPVPTLAPDTSLSEDNQISINLTGTADYVLLSDLTDATHPNRFMKNSVIECDLRNDVAVKFLTPATRNGSGTRIKACLGEKKLDDFCGDINLRFTTFSAMGAGDNFGNIGKLRGVGSSAGTDRNNIDMSQSGGTRIDEIARTFNADATGGDQSFGPTVANVHLCGNAAFPWKGIFSQNAPTTTSDERLKEGIRPLTNEELAAGRALQPVVYRWREGDGLIHAGVVAQEVVKAFEQQGLNALEYGVVIYENDQFFVNYAELMVFVWAIQDQRIAALESAI